MSRTGDPSYNFQSRPISPVVAGTIKQFSESRRNAIRGAISEAVRDNFGSDKINVFRENTLESDMVAAATILESPGGLRNRSVKGLIQSDISFTHKMKAKEAHLEVAYACGFLNAWKDQSVTAISTIAMLSHVAQVPRKDAIGAIRKAVETWGASNYIAHKIAYAKEFLDLDSEDQESLEEIDKILEHHQSPLIQYSAIENIKEKIPLFSIAKRYTNISSDVENDDFRRCYTLNNLVATPISHVDCGIFILRAVETSLVDTAFSFWVLTNLGERFPKIIEVIQTHLLPEIRIHLANLQGAILSVEAPDLLKPIKNEEQSSTEKEEQRDDPSLTLYRRSAVFLEYPKLCLYRNDLDRVIGHRLVAPLLSQIKKWHGESFNDSEVLKQPNEIFEISLHNTKKIKIDTFYRTYLFLRLIQDPHNLSFLKSEDFQHIFNSTMRLESLLLERELKTMHLNASEDSRALISVLALALYRSKSADPDIDFDFREKLEDFIIKNFNGKISSFIEYLIPKSPEIANYIATSLDELTLEKMYSIVKSPMMAENIRRDILISVGIHLNKIEYIIEAEAIETRSKVAKLKDYFDGSRMFVDSVAMKKWLSLNPSAYTQQYKESIPKVIARMASAGSVTKSNGEEKKFEIYQLSTINQYLIEQMATEAFREFCINNEFGLESYLGRRIRHNTLQGVMTKAVDAVLQRSEYRPIIVGTPFGGAIRGWENSYKIFIERMRREFLQFRSESKPNSLFYSDTDINEPATKRNIQQLSHTLRLSGPEMVDELIISFCWNQIAFQLETASRNIRVKMAQEVTQNLTLALQRFHGPEEQKIRSALTDAITSVFAQVASWFQVPQTGFTPASIPEICNIIDIEHSRAASSTIVKGEHTSLKYYGISVHRIYDCLAVLLQNAFKHGKSGSEIIVKMSSTPIDTTNLHLLDISVLSTLPEKDAQTCISRVEAAVNSSETGSDMVTEGYSGIKKIKFITRLNEGESTVSYKIENNTIDILFSLKVETSIMENIYEKNSPS